MSVMLRLIQASCPDDTNASNMQILALIPAHDTCKRFIRRRIMLGSEIAPTLSVGSRVPVREGASGLVLKCVRLPEFSPPACPSLSVRR
jgi:hypothetical protein